MAKYYYTSEDRKTHYDGIIDGKISKPFIGVIYHFWDEIYKGKKNKKGEREGQGTMEWNFDTKGNWRFEDWANNEFWHYSKNPKRKRPPFGFNGLGELVYMRTYSRIKEEFETFRWIAEKL